MKGAWQINNSMVSRPPRGGRGLKYVQKSLLEILLLKSPPSRGAWIEIWVAKHKDIGTTVAPLAGGVD